jgi:hypothetical protein
MGAGMRVRCCVIGSVWLVVGVVMSASFLQAEERPAPPAKSLMSTKLPDSDFSLALKTDRMRGSADTQPTPSGLAPYQREPKMPLVGFSLSKPLDYPK